MQLTRANMKTKPISIRRALINNITVLMLVLGIAIIGAMFYSASTQVRALSNAIIDRALTQTRFELRQYFNPVTSNLDVLKQWGEKGLLTTNNPESITPLLQPFIQKYPQISSLLIADAEGNEYMLLQKTDGWINRITRPGQWGKRSKIISWNQINSNQNSKKSAQWKSLDYDPRQRPWFKGAMTLPAASSSFHWTQPYTFYTTKEPGITVSSTFQYKNKTYVIGFDILLTDITRFTQALRISDNGKALIVTHEGKLVGLPAEDNFQSKPQQLAVLLKKIDSLDISVITDGFRAYKALANDHSGLFTFKTNGQLWWAGTTLYQLDATNKKNTQDDVFWIGVLIPESDVLGQVLWLRYAMIMFILTALAFSLWRATRMAKRYSQPIEQLVENSHRISQGDLEPNAPIHSRVLEVQKLASAQDDMRVGLRTLLKLERDMQLARKIQRDTIPVHLPQSPKYQLACWSEAADETGGDTYDVIGIHHATQQLTGADQQADALLFMLADAAGHGIGPALSVTQVRSMLRMAARMGSDAAAILQHMNQQLCADLHDGRFVTLWLGALDTKAHQLMSFSAGQAPLFFYQAKKQDVTILQADNPPLGIMRDLDYSAHTTHKMKQGDMFVVMSDGIYEAVNASGEAFGAPRVMDIIKQCATKHPDELLKQILLQLRQFNHFANAADDQTIIIIKRDAN